MAPPFPRELEITYGALTVGGVTDYEIHEKLVQSDAYEKSTLRFRLVVRASTAGGLKALCDSVEAAFRIPRQALEVKMGGVTMKKLTPADHTGFNATAQVSKVGGDFDSGRAREYEVQVDVERPADLAGQNGRRYSRTVLNTEPGGRRAMTISGRYTVVPGGALTARAQYDAQIAAFEAAVQGSFPAGTWRFLSKRVENDDANKNCDFEHTYEEVLNGGRRLSLVLVLTEPGGRRIVTISGRYTATPDPGGKSARQNYLDNIDAFVAAVLAGIAPAGVWQRTDKQFSNDDLNQNCDFSETYEEVKAPDGDPGPNVTKSLLTITRVSEGPGDSPPSPALGRARRLETLRADFTGWVDITKTTPAAEYQATVRGWIIRQVERAFGLAGAALVDESARPSPLDGQLGASLTFRAVVDGDVLEYRMSIRLNENPGRTIARVWDANPYAGHVFPYPASLMRTLVERWVQRDDPLVAKPDSLVRGAGPLARKTSPWELLPVYGENIPFSGWIRQDRAFDEEPIRYGIPPYTFDAVARTVTTVHQWVEPTTASGGG